MNLDKYFATRTDCFLHAIDGHVTREKDYIVVRSPLNPGFYWGNYIILRDLPESSTAASLEALHRKHFPDLAHVAIEWLSPKQLHIPGWSVVTDGVLVKSQFSAPHPTQEIRTLDVQSDWPAVSKLNAHCDPLENSGLAHYDAFKERLRNRYARLLQANLGGWYGYFKEGSLVAQLGIFGDSDHGRLQSVETHPDFRRQGICQSLVTFAANDIATEKQWKSVTVVADQNSSAESIYKRCGFNSVGIQRGIFRPPKNE